MNLVQPPAGHASRLALVLAWFGLTAIGPADERLVSYPAKTMGTLAQVTLATSDSARSAPTARAAHAVFARVDSLMSNWTATSEVARINREAGTHAVSVEPEVARVIAMALDAWRDSQGAFDITVEPLVRAWGFLGGPRRVPAQSTADSAFAKVGAADLDFDRTGRRLQFRRPGMQIDLGGIAKGHAVDAAAESLKARGETRALIDVSGNMFALGAPPDRDHWRIGIRDPRDRMSYIARLHLRDQAVSTSGRYEQFVVADGRTFGHIMDPRTGWPAEGLIGVTVVAASAEVADAWSTALFVVGPAEARRLARARQDLEVVLVIPGPNDRDSVWVEASLESRFVVETGARRLFHIEVDSPDPSRVVGQNPR
jgi:thiamine biosynthesis lipoprotein